MSDPNIRADAYAHVEALDASLPATDRVYRNVATGRFIKVRVTRAPAPEGAPRFGMLVYAVSGSHCDENGWAMAHGEGHAVAPQSNHTIQADKPVDLAVTLELIRRDTACSTERAVELEQAAMAAG